MEFYMQGFLGRRKKNGVVTEFYTLSQHSLDAFRSEQDFMAGQLPPRQVICEEIMRVETQEDGFWVHLDDRVIELLQLEEGSAYKWLKRLRKVLGDRVDVGAEAFHKPQPVEEMMEQRDPLFQGVLSKVDKKKGSKPGFYVLFENTLEYYTSQADFETGAEVRGLVLFNEVLFFQEIEKGFVLTVDAGPAKGERLVELHVPSPDLMQPWIDAMKAVLQPLLNDKFVTSTIGQANPTVREQDGLLIEGTLSCKKSTRHCMLFTDRFEYFTNKEEYERAPDVPRGAVYLTELDGFELSEDGFAFFIADRRVDYKTSPEIHQDWIEAWEVAEGREVAEGIEKYEKLQKSKSETATKAPNGSMSNGTKPAVAKTELPNGSTNGAKPGATAPGSKNPGGRGQTYLLSPKKGLKEAVEEDGMTTVSTNPGARSAAHTDMSLSSVGDWDTSPTAGQAQDQEHQAASQIQRTWRERQSLGRGQSNTVTGASNRMGSLKSSEVLSAPAKPSAKAAAAVKQPAGASRTPRNAVENAENDRQRRSSLSSTGSDTRSKKKRVTLIEGIESWEGTFDFLAGEVDQEEKRASIVKEQKAAVQRLHQYQAKNPPGTMRSQSLTKDRAQTDEGAPYFKRSPGRPAAPKAAAARPAPAEVKPAVSDAKSPPSQPQIRRSFSAQVTARRSFGSLQLASTLFDNVRMEGMLGIDVLGQRELRYFVVFRDHLHMYGCLEDVERGQVQVRINASDVRGFKVSSSTISVVMDAQNVALRVRESAMVDPWLTALKDMVKTVEELTVDNGAPMHEGPIKLAMRNKMEDRYCVLYKDRFETYMDRCDFKRGNKHVGCFQMGDIETFEVQNANFMVQVKDRIMKFYAYRQVDMRDWARAWYDVLAIKDSSTKAVKKWDRREINARNHKEWTANTSVVEGKVYQGPIGWEHPNGAIEPRYFVICKDRLEFFSDPNPAFQGQGNTLHTVIKLRDMRGLKVVDDGFYIETTNRGKEQPPRIKLRLGEPELLDTWVFHLKSVVDRYHSDEVRDAGQDAVPQTNAMRMHPLEAIPPNSLFAVPKKEMMQAEMKHPLLQAWTSKEKPMHHGLLGIVRAGEMTLRFFALFPDRLDGWNRPSDAASGLRPVLHIPMADIRSVETVSSGMIVNCRGKKMGIHVSSNNELHEWSQALLKALAPASRSSSVPPRGQNTTVLKTRVLSTERTSCVGRARSEERSRGPTSPRGAAPKNTQIYYDRHPYPAKPQVAKETTMRPAEDFSFAERAHGKMQMPHNASGTGYNNSDVSPKVSGPRQDVAPRQPEHVTQKINDEIQRIVKPGPEPGWCPWAKVTCMEENGGYTPPRSRSPTPSPRISPRVTPCASPRASPRHSTEVTQKINCADDRSLARPGREELTPKVNGPDKVPLRRDASPRRSISDAPFKVTDAGRQGRGWATKDPNANFLDKTAPIAQRQHQAYTIGRARTPR